MSYRKLLVHRCDVYYLKSRLAGGGVGFGVPSTDQEEEFFYDVTPDLEDVPCYFVEKSQMLVQGEPNHVIMQSFNVHFLPAADVRTNSKIVWDGVAFKSQKPKPIRNHHQEVTVSRSENL